jgi:hypothetical protein
MPAAARPYWTGFLKLSLVTILAEEGDRAAPRGAGRTARSAASARGGNSSRAQPSLLLPVEGGRAKAPRPAQAAAVPARRRKKA